ncbi:MAG: type III-B CRISPR module RAMP protein Cmr6 [Chloroflexota bacterium]|nr:type III-B CRISPR module RAMP protein Cmr6 [Chloroflexota bacterium]
MADNFQSRRPVLQRVSPDQTTNAGLWLDKYIDHKVSSNAEKPEKNVIDEVSEIPMPAEYEQFYNRWEYLLKAKCPLPPKKAEVQGRLAIGLGAESVLETSITLLRAYGMPYIPGSALKGLAAFYARNYLVEEDWDMESEAYRTLFGDTDAAGYVTFYDALYVPGSGFKNKEKGKRQALWPDIITVHHPEYYQGKNKPPADWDNPTPIHFISATGEYLIALDGPDKFWVERTFEILELALAELGVGAKTSSGYGRILLGEAREKAEKAKETYAVAKNRLLMKERPPKGRVRGTVKNVQGSYGFIKSPHGGGDDFIHQSEIRGDDKQLINGQIIEYRRVDTDKGTQARDVDILLNP